MGRDARTYITVHDGMPEHPKVEPLSDAAFRLLIESWCYSSRNLSDGVILAAVWAKRGTPKVRRELEAAGLVEACDGGVLLHDYTQHQRTRAEVEAQRARNAENGRKGGQAKAAGRKPARKPAAKQPASEPAATGQPAASESLDVVEGQLLPDQGEQQRMASRQTAQTLLGEWIDHCATKPPQRVIGHVAKELGAMLLEGIAYEQVRAGLASWAGKGLSPATLASEVHAVGNLRRPGPAATRHEEQQGDLFDRMRAVARDFDERQAG